VFGWRPRCDARSALGRKSARADFLGERDLCEHPVLADFEQDAFCILVAGFGERDACAHAWDGHDAVHAGV
jgi:hypothetical protein